MSFEEICLCLCPGFNLFCNIFFQRVVKFKSLLKINFARQLLFWFCQITVKT